MTPQPESWPAISLPKAKLRVLEAMFAKEVNDSLSAPSSFPSGFYQSRAKIMDELLKDQLVFVETVKLGGAFPATFTGYLLTHAGRFAYCSTCDDEE